MTSQLAIRLDVDDLAALDELARRDGLTRSEAVRRAIRLQTENTIAAQNRAELDRVGALLGVEPGSRWLTGADVITTLPDDEFAADIAAALGADSTDDMVDPWAT